MMKTQPWDKLDILARRIVDRREDFAEVPLTRAQKLYVSLAANRFDLLQAEGLTIAEAVSLLQPAGLEALIKRWGSAAADLRGLPCEVFVNDVRVSTTLAG